MHADDVSSGVILSVNILANDMWTKTNKQKQNEDRNEKKKTISSISVLLLMFELNMVWPLSTS